jgi:hypothetical protein
MSTMLQEKQCEQCVTWLKRLYVFGDLFLKLHYSVSQSLVDGNLQPKYVGIFWVIAQNVSSVKSDSITYYYTGIYLEK